MAVRKYVLPWLKTKQATRVVVIGDAILDEYLEGSVNRISPEAPVPIHRVTRSFATAGGAANVARNVQLAGGQAILLTACGADEGGRELIEILNKDGIKTDCMIKAKDRPTIRKVRVTSNNHQLIRIDWEKPQPISADDQKTLLLRLSEIEFDAILLSDYSKGALPPEFLTEVFKIAKEHAKPVIVDPKGGDYSRYRGATLITPNRKEACEALGLGEDATATPLELGRLLQKKYDLNNVLVTLGAKGMFLVREREYRGSEESLHLPTMAREVFDVSGAGDAVVAIMALALAAGAGYKDAMHLANVAAGRVVERWGTQPITRDDLEQRLKEETHDPRVSVSTAGKIVNQDAISRLIPPPSVRKDRVVFTNGCFDILHAGHVTYLEEARALGDILVVGVNSDRSISKIKGPSRPIVTEQHRMRVLAGLSCVDFVVAFDEETPDELIKLIIPNVLVKGADWTRDNTIGVDTVESHGGVFKTIALVPGLSTSNIVDKIKKS